MRSDEIRNNWIQNSPWLQAQRSATISWRVSYKNIFPDRWIWYFPGLIADCIQTFSILSWRRWKYWQVGLLLPDRDVHTTSFKGAPTHLEIDSLLWDRVPLTCELVHVRLEGWGWFCLENYLSGALPSVSAQGRDILRKYLFQIAGNGTSRAHKLHLDRLYFAIPFFRKRTLAHKKE